MAVRASAAGDRRLLRAGIKNAPAELYYAHKDYDAMRFEVSFQSLAVQLKLTIEKTI